MRVFGGSLTEDLATAWSERGPLLLVVGPLLVWTFHDYWVARFGRDLFLPSFLFLGLIASAGPVVAAWERGEGWWLWIYAPLAYGAALLLRRRFLNREPADTT